MQYLFALEKPATVSIISGPCMSSAMFNANQSQVTRSASLPQKPSLLTSYCSPRCKDFKAATRVVRNSHLRGEESASLGADPNVVLVQQSTFQLATKGVLRRCFNRTTTCNYIQLPLNMTNIVYPTFIHIILPESQGSLLPCTCWIHGKPPCRSGLCWEVAVNFQ